MVNFIFVSIERNFYILAYFGIFNEYAAAAAMLFFIRFSSSFTYTTH